MNDILCEFGCTRSYYKWCLIRGSTINWYVKLSDKSKIFISTYLKKYKKEKKINENKSDQCDKKKKEMWKE